MLTFGLGEGATIIWPESRILSAHVPVMVVAVAITAVVSNRRGYCAKYS
ncbi:hypothetical protein [Plastoroseomonas arctica]|uniref:Uncharacterized protein n=1 Tax=Plastoroseomonas arctica TaxID=1509237 RepID=A0AAF1JX22_9PROT|nr:hypothetical protein [Plastoroseomonas arctica]MBR0655807.1 hypothetical protein [Plastoroseomonas arctica]